MNEHILIVDDEKEIADLLEVYLKNDGYIVHKFYNGTDALHCIASQKIDLAVFCLFHHSRAFRRLAADCYPFCVEASSLSGRGGTGSQTVGRSNQ